MWSIETGVAHGGSLIFYASLFEAMQQGRVIGVDIEIRPHNRAAIEAHPLAARITLIEGSSIARATVDAVRAQIQAGETVLVVLDSNHSTEHVAAELDRYAPDGLARLLHRRLRRHHGAGRRRAAHRARTGPGTTRCPPSRTSSPASHEFVRGGTGRSPSTKARVRDRVTYWPKCFLKRVAGGGAP